jgi:hypothetical protein
VFHEAERITGRTVVALECTRVDWRRGPPVVAKRARLRSRSRRPGWRRLGPRIRTPTHRR